MKKTLYDCPEELRFYEIELSTKKKFYVTGDEKTKIMHSPSQFVQLKSGEVINKAHIVSISLEKEMTKDSFRKHLIDSKDKSRLT